LATCSQLMAISQSATAAALLRVKRTRSPPNSSIAPTTNASTGTMNAPAPDTRRRAFAKSRPISPVSSAGEARLTRLMTPSVSTRIPATSKASGDSPGREVLLDEVFRISPTA